MGYKYDIATGHLPKQLKQKEIYINNFAFPLSSLNKNFLLPLRVPGNFLLEGIDSKRPVHQENLSIAGIPPFYCVRWAGGPATAGKPDLLLSTIAQANRSQI